MSASHTTAQRADTPGMWVRTPYELDPLTWLAGNRLPLVFAVLIALISGISIAPATGTFAEILTQLGTIGLMSTACIIIYWFVRPVRHPLSPRRTLIPVAVASIATVLSALNPGSDRTASALIEVEVWWAPLGFALVLGALVPYTSVLTALLLGGIAATVTATSAALAFGDSDWPIVSTIAIALVPIIIATSGTVAFQAQVVARISRWAARATPPVVSGRLLRERARLAAVHAELDAVSRRVSGFLTGVAERAHVTDADSEQAADLARQIRTELVERSNETWLQTVARGRPITIIDPDQLADTMTDTQRSSVHALILTVLDSPEVEYPHVLIELRRDSGDTIAVAITIDAGLAEGRRVMLLAPHYLSLRSAADDLRWKGGDTIRMRFRVAPGRAEQHSQHPD